MRLLTGVNWCRWRLGLAAQRIWRAAPRAILALGTLACLLLMTLVWHSFISGPSLEVDGNGDHHEQQKDQQQEWQQRSRPRGNVQPASSAEVRRLVESVYTGINGGALSAEDVALANAGGTFQKTYGEFAAAGVDVLLDVLNVSHGDIFCDLGSGTGKVVMQAFLQRRPTEAFGIELSERRHQHAIEAYDRLSQSLGSEPSGLRYLHGDVFESDGELARCNKIFLCSTVWPQELRDRMEKKLLSLQFRQLPVLLASSRELKGLGELLEPQRSPGARFLRHARVDTSWGASFITLYALGEPNDKQPRKAN